jgi:hypothetical protein
MDNAESEYRQQIAQTIIHQLGGSGKLKAMVNARGFIALKSGFQFKFSGSRKANGCKIIYNSGSDLYTFELWQIYPNSNRFKKVYSLTDVYFDILIELFESYTGLYLHL